MIVNSNHGFPTAFFFFQAEDGIRDRDVTGVQTCALPISSPARLRVLDRIYTGRMSTVAVVSGACAEIGRASCRERVEISVAGVSVKEKESGVWDGGGVLEETERGCRR